MSRPREATHAEMAVIEAEAMQELIRHHIDHWQHLKRRAAENHGLALPGQARRSLEQRRAREAAQRAKPGQLKVAS